MLVYSLVQGTKIRPHQPARTCPVHRWPLCRTDALYRNPGSAPTEDTGLAIPEVRLTGLPEPVAGPSDPVARPKPYTYETINSKTNKQDDETYWTSEAFAKRNEGTPCTTVSQGSYCGRYHPAACHDKSNRKEMGSNKAKGNTLSGCCLNSGMVDGRGPLLIYSYPKSLAD